MLIYVFKRQTVLDHHDLHVIEQLAHLFGSAIGAFIFGGDSCLRSFFDDFLADEVCALIKLINGKRSFRTSLRFFGQFCKQRFECLHSFS